MRFSVGLAADTGKKATEGHTPRKLGSGAEKGHDTTNSCCFELRYECVGGSYPARTSSVQ
jgi:hypothetical protein